MNRNLNRIKAVLADRNKTSKWLAEQLHKDPATVSKWCTNASQPSLKTLLNICKALNADLREVVCIEFTDEGMSYEKNEN
ncbi:helix-turn-helix transcriptional regulator [Porphyromonas canoris]|uniref:HTH cro/C1-type domain-containing protein n=1 Tax=Porphyromonas canoris TaxID=36875 RepID=A0ABR4XLH6_9PORP|nr:helix-turn-helix transcriptional regulator [Porphyromonas canoris]KGN92444.1 hypothetical protein HQ43_05330 [Porphyromonas canoris]